MAHFAELDQDNNVLRVVYVNNSECVDADGVEQEFIGAAFCSKIFGGRWIQTSFSNSFRRIFAGTGYKYDPEKDIFFDPLVGE
jgi:hypothetical protein